MTRGKNSKSYKFHFPVSHRPPGVVSFCSDDHVHDDHLVCSGCHAQSRLALLLRTQQMQRNGKTFSTKVKLRKTFFIYFYWTHHVTATAPFNLWQLRYVGYVSLWEFLPYPWLLDQVRLSEASPRLLFWLFLLQCALQSGTSNSSWHIKFNTTNIFMYIKFNKHVICITYTYILCDIDVAATCH